MLILVGVYVPLALTFSLLTRAYEAPDEPSHVRNIEYIVGHHALPRIGVSNGLESHQPPLYYLLGAGWQDLLGVHAFTPVVDQTKGLGFLTGQLLYSTRYTARQHQEAVDLHELRLLSVLLGAGTVLLTYAAAKVIGMRETVALASGLFVALFPKSLTITSTVTNDALMIPLCSLALVLFLLSERAVRQGRFRHRRIHLVAMGLVLGAAAITKLNSLTIAAVLFTLAAVPAVVGARRALQGSRKEQGCFFDFGLAVVGFFAVSGWWFLRNDHLYGQFLATNASQRYLEHFELHSQPWSSHVLFNVFPTTLLTFTWFTQPNFFLPLSMNQILGVLAVPCLVIGGWVMIWQRPWISKRVTSLSGFAVVGCILGGLVALLIIIKETGQADTRDAFVGLSAFAIVMLAGSTRILSRFDSRLELIGVALWPVLFLGLDVYLLIHRIIPLGGL